MACLSQIRKEKHHKFLLHKNKIKVNEYINILGFDELKTKGIINFKIIEKIQKFFRLYNLRDKICNNLYEIIDINDKNIIKIKINDEIFGYHYLTFDLHFDLYGFCDINNKTPLNGYVIKRTVNNIKCKSSYIYEKINRFAQINGYYENNNNSFEIHDIYNLFESRGINKIKVTHNIYEEWLQLENEVYAIEIAVDNSYNRSYAILDDTPTDDDDIQIPLNIFLQLNQKPNITNFYYRIIKPPKGSKIKLKCFINPSKLFINIKEQLTNDINKHKVLSLNQIICVETDTNKEIVPFIITELSPSNVIDVTNIDLEIDFDECYHFDDSISSILSNDKLFNLFL